MGRFILLCTSLCAMMLLISAGPVQAQTVMWVSATGSGTTCSTAAPCATFQAAINAGATQINCLTSGNYGPVTITASITIDCGTGNVGNVVFAVGSAISINTSAAATIVLRHLNINGLGNTNGSYSGIDTPSFPGGALIVEDCMIHGYRGDFGISFSPASGRGLLQVSNTQIFDNGSGIVVSPASGQIASVMLNRVDLVANSNFGLGLGGPGIVAGTMRDSMVGGNGVTGVLSVASQVYFTVEESSIVDNLTYGIQTNSPGSSLKLGASTIGGNGTGVFAQQGSIISFGNNQMSDNGSNGNFTSTISLR